MNKNRFLLIALLPILLICCKSELKKEETQTQSKGKKEVPNVFKNIEKSRVEVNIEGAVYTSTVNCSYYNEDYFYFKSDKLETTDTNGDGIVINGHQQDDKIALTLIVEGTTYSASNFNIQKKEFTATGTGKLFKEGTAKAFKASYTVMCK